MSRSQDISKGVNDPIDIVLGHCGKERKRQCPTIVFDSARQIDRTVALSIEWLHVHRNIVYLCADPTFAQADHQAPPIKFQSREIDKHGA